MIVNIITMIVCITILTISVIKYKDANKLYEAVKRVIDDVGCNVNANLARSEIKVESIKRTCELTSQNLTKYIDSTTVPVRPKQLVVERYKNVVEVQGALEVPMNAEVPDEVIKEEIARQICEEIKSNGFIEMVCNSNIMYNNITYVGRLLVGRRQHD